jgi:hypothetical protein
LKANHKDGKFVVGNSSIDVKRGQLLTGRKSLSKATGIQESKIERLLKLLKSEQQIEQQTFTKYRLISITNYDEYQEANNKVSNKRTTNEQQTNTNNNVNNDNKKETRKKPVPLKIDKPEDVEEEVWQDWNTLRKTKKAPVTNTVIKGAIKEAGKAGVPLNEFLQIWCRRGSQGLEASWLKPDDFGSVKQEWGGNVI